MGDVGVRSSAERAEQLAYEAEKHFHRWGEGTLVYGSTAGVAPGVRDGSTAYSLLSGTDDFGDEVLVFNGTETPAQTGAKKFDVGDLQVTGVDQTDAVFIIKIYCGTGTFGESELLTSFTFIAATNQITEGEATVNAGRCDAGDKIWMTAKCLGQTEKTISLHPEIHEYPR